MKAKIFLPAFVVVATLCGCGGKGDQVAVSPEVDVYQVTPQEVTIRREFVGQIFGKKDIAIRARVEGYLEGIFFKEGSHVRRGDRP